MYMYIQSALAIPDGHTIPDRIRFLSKALIYYIQIPLVIKLRYRSYIVPIYQDYYEAAYLIR